MTPDAISLADHLAQARARLVAAGIRADEAAIDVDVYAQAILAWDKATLLTHLREPAPAALEPRLSEWLARRERREPTAYIVGRREFWGRAFQITPAVLVPRPETEFIVEEALPLVRERSAPRIADIGTGSGILAVTLAAELPTAALVATDVSAEALQIADRNAHEFGDATGPVIALEHDDQIDGVRDELALRRDVGPLRESVESRERAGRGRCVNRAQAARVSRDCGVEEVERGVVANFADHNPVRAGAERGFDERGE